MENIIEPRWDWISDIKDTSATIVISSLQATPDTFTGIGIRRLEEGSIPKRIGTLETWTIEKEFFINKLKPNQEYIFGYYDENNDFVDASELNSDINSYTFITTDVIEEQAPLLSDIHLRYLGDDNMSLVGDIDHKTSLDVIVHYSVYDEQYELLTNNDLHLSLNNDDYTINSHLANYSYKEVNYFEMSYSYIDSLGNKSDILTDYQSIDTNILLPGTVENLSHRSDSSVKYVEPPYLEIGLVVFASITFIIIVVTRFFRDKLVARFFKN